MRHYSVYILLFTVSIFSSGFIFGQKLIKSNELNDCDGAVNVFESGVYNIKFLGNPGKKNDIDKYPSLKSVKESNSIWISFIAPYDGFLNLEASVNKGDLQMVIFLKNIRGSICEQIEEGTSEISRLIDKKGFNSLGLNKKPKLDSNQLYSTSLNRGDKILLYFNKKDLSRGLLKLNLNFQSKSSNNRSNELTKKIVDFREDEFSPAINIVVRDASTGLPVIANLIVEGSKSLEGVYEGSDFYFVSTRMVHLILKCDVKGYFFMDKEVRIANGQGTEINFWLEPIMLGKSMQIEEVEFHPGTSIFLPSAMPKLNRLKDFLTLNSDIKVEIQGHVYSPKAISIMGQIMSEARARRVYNYLVDNGIDKKRMKSVGYGNKKPVYPNPQFDYEEQMNRRVEVKILEQKKETY